MMGAQIGLRRFTSELKEKALTGTLQPDPIHATQTKKFERMTVHVNSNFARFLLTPVDYLAVIPSCNQNTGNSYTHFP